MKDAVLLELANRWENEADPKDSVEDGSPNAQRGNDIVKGHRECKRECADTIKMLVSLIGDN